MSTQQERRISERIRRLEQEYLRASAQTGSETEDSGGYTWDPVVKRWLGPPTAFKSTLDVNAYSADPGTPVGINFAGDPPYVDTDDGFTSNWNARVYPYEPYPLVSGFTFENLSFAGDVTDVVITSVTIYFRSYTNDASQPVQMNVYLWDGTQWSSPSNFGVTYGLSWHTYSLPFTSFLDTQTKINVAKLKVLCTQGSVFGPFAYTTHTYLIIQGTYRQYV